MTQPRIMIVEARFYQDLADEMAAGAIAAIEARGGAYQRFAVPGAFEIPLTCNNVIKSFEVESVIALGVIIRGDTPHFDYVAAGCTNGIVQVSLQTGVPISFGVLTLDSYDQAAERSGVGPENKGTEAALTSLEMACLLKKIG